MSADLRVLAVEAAAWMKARSPGTEAEVFLSRTRESILSRREGARESARAAAGLGAGVRVLQDGRAGFAAAGGADAGTLRSLWERAAAQLAVSPPDRARALPPARTEPEDAALAASLWDAESLEVPWEALDALLAGAEASASGAASGVRVLRSELALSREETVVASTRGALAAGRGTFASVEVAAACESGGETQVGDGLRGARRLSALDAAAAGREAGRRAAAGVGARRPRSGRRAVLFEPWVGAELLELLSGLFSAEEVQGHRSLLEGRLGAAIASSLVTLRDDPRLPGGPASALCDDEGVPTGDKALVERGVLRGLFYDTAAASRENAAPNGCAWRGGWSRPPAPGPSNFHLAPGDRSRDALVADTRDGLLVLEVLGLHTADPVSGEFSVGVSGFEIESGALARPFQGAMIAGNLLDLLARVDAVADDLAFYGSFGAPTFRVASLDVA